MIFSYNRFTLNHSVCVSQKQILLKQFAVKYKAILVFKTPRGIDSSTFTSVSLRVYKRLTPSKISMTLAVYL